MTHPGDMGLPPPPVYPTSGEPIEGPAALAPARWRRPWRRPRRQASWDELDRHLFTDRAVLVRDLRDAARASRAPELLEAAALVIELDGQTIGSSHGAWSSARAAIVAQATIRLAHRLVTTLIESDPDPAGLAFQLGRLEALLAPLPEEGLPCDG